MDAEKNLSINLNTDSDGYINQECPYCKKRFKVKPGSGSNRAISYCPYCGRNGKDCWWTQEQVDFMSGVLHTELIEPAFEKMAKDINRTAGRGGLVKMTMNEVRSPKPPMPEESNNEMSMTTFKCCGETIKHEGSNHSLYCIICGKNKEDS